MKIVWTATAVHHLEEIYSFLGEKSENVASRLIEAILIRTLQLEQFPYSGPVQPFRGKKTKREYRILIEDHYKIFYTVKGSFVYIETVFDSRQNPKKLK